MDMGWIKIIVACILIPAIDDLARRKINVTMNHCEAGSAPVNVAAMDNEPWQQHARMAGLNQKMLAKLLGVSENTVSQQLRGKWQSGTPQYVKTVILAWGHLSPEAREKLWSQVNGEG